MKFLQISDLHFKKEYAQVRDGYLSIFPPMTTSLEQLRCVLQGIDLKRYAGVCICGDLTENGDPEDYQFLRRKLETVFEEIPCMVIPGNHDKASLLRETWYGSSQSEYRYGWSRRFGEIQIIGMDNSKEGCPDGEITDEHTRWLREHLIKGKKECRRTFLMMHHPLVYDEMVPVPPVRCVDGLPQLLDAYPPDLILCGHTHNYKLSKYRKSLHLTCDGCAFRGQTDPDGKVTFREHAGLNELEIDGNRMIINRIVSEKHTKVLGKAYM